MSIYATASDFVQTTFNTATGSMKTLNKGLDIANHFVDKNHKRLTVIITEDAKFSLAEHHETMAAKLEANPKLKAQYEALGDDW